MLRPAQIEIVPVELLDPTVAAQQHRHLAAGIERPIRPLKVLYKTSSGSRKK